MARKSRTREQEPSRPPDQQPAAEGAGPTEPVDRDVDETATAGQPTATPQSLERLRRRLKAKYH